MLAALGQQDATVSLELEFGLDSSGRILVSGAAEVHAKLMCFLCMKLKTCTITSFIDTRLVHSEAEAQEIFAEFDAIVVPEGPITIQKLIEDDLLLSIPSRVCDDNSRCSNVEQSSTSSTEAPMQRPFKNIKHLLG